MKSLVKIERDYAMVRVASRMKIALLKRFLENTDHPISSRVIVYGNYINLIDGVNLLCLPYNHAALTPTKMYTFNPFKTKTAESIENLPDFLKETRVPQGRNLLDMIFKVPIQKRCSYDMKDLIKFLSTHINHCESSYNFRKFYLSCFTPKQITVELYDKVPYAPEPKYLSVLDMGSTIDEVYYLDPIRLVTILNFLYKEYSLTSVEVCFSRTLGPVYLYFPEKPGLKAMIMPVEKNRPRRQSYYQKRRKT